ncbi:hypothetical protein ACTQ54_06530 [Fundicoccus sp. Sow4_H7]|uniref:hypothetical protein n=1 Tax=Fundicoccus sp. Sow4_H7 TaxID=3438784 RepID=UPI003F911C2E
MKNRSKQAKLAYSMPIVLVFMVISQLIYWGILRLNYTQSSQNKAYQNYYLAQIHYLMLDNFLTVDTDLISEDLQQTISSQINLIHQEIDANHSVIQAWPLNCQFGIKQLETEGDHERFWLYYTEVFVDEIGLNYCSSMADLHCFGQIMPDASYQYLNHPQLNEGKTDWLAAFYLIQDDLLSNGYRLANQRQRNRQFEWKQPIVEGQQFHSDYMNIQFVPSIQQFEYHVNRFDHSYHTQFTQEIQRGKALIRYTGFLFEKENID